MAMWPHFGKSVLTLQVRSGMVPGLLSACLLLSGCSGNLQESLSGTPMAAAPTADAGVNPVATGSTQPAPQSELHKATTYWAKEFSNNPRNVEAAVNYAKNLKAMGEKDRAMAVLQQAAIYNADHKGLASEYGRSALDADQAQLAEKLLARAEDPLKPDWKVISAQGAAIAKQGRHRDAIALFERALALSPENPSILNNLGMAQAMNGDAPKAEVTLRKAADLPGASPRVRQNLALILGLQGKFEEARQIAGADMPPEKVAASIAYLRRMVDEQAVAGAQADEAAALPPAVGKPAQRKAAATPSAQGFKESFKGTQGPIAAAAKDVPGTGWSTNVASAAAAGEAAELRPARR